MEDGYDYDPGTKLWTTVLGVILMLLVQWPALFTARLQNPPHEGHMGWNLFACLLGLAAPIAWLVNDVGRRRGIAWIVVVAVVGTWAAVSIAWVDGA